MAKSPAFQLSLFQQKKPNITLSITRKKGRLVVHPGGRASMKSRKMQLGSLSTTNAPDLARSLGGFFYSTSQPLAI